MLSTVGGTGEKPKIYYVCKSNRLATPLTLCIFQVVFTCFTLLIFYTKLIINLKQKKKISLVTYYLTKVIDQWTKEDQYE